MSEHCIRCGYNLATLTDRQPCPECGLLVGLSRLPAEELRSGRPAWLSGLRRGGLLVGLGILLLPIAAITFSTFSLNLTDEWTMAVALSASLLPSALLLLIGVWLLSRSTGPGRSDGDMLLRVLSVWAAIAAAGPVLVYYVLRLSGSLGMMFSATSLVIAFGGVVAIALFKRLAVLARRAPAPLLASDMPWMGWIVAAAFAVPLITTLSLLFPLPIHQQLTVYLWLAAGVFVMTVWAWSIYLMIRAAIAFGQPLKQARALWAEGDLSAPTRAGETAG